MMRKLRLVVEEGELGLWLDLGVWLVDEVMVVIVVGLVEGLLEKLHWILVVKKVLI